MFDNLSKFIFSNNPHKTIISKKFKLNKPKLIKNSNFKSSNDPPLNNHIKFVPNSFNKIPLNNPIIHIPKNIFLPPQNINPIIPLNVYQTWHNKNLPTKMKECHNNLKNNNPEFTFHLFDDSDCRLFIKNNFSPNVLNAFDQLNPGAYKADLWRCCILYKLGGIYLDIKFKTTNNFKLIYLSDKEYFCNDIPKSNYDKNTFNYGIYNGFMICLPGNVILKKIINQIVTHVQKRYYGPTPLSPTGPMLLKRYFSNEERSKFPLNFFSYKVNGKKEQCIRFNNIIILDVYPSYRNEQTKFQKTKHYSYIWDQHNIYFEKSKKIIIPINPTPPLTSVQQNLSFDNPEFIDLLSSDSLTT